MKIPIGRGELTAFLIDAKRRTYAAGGSGSEAVVTPLLPGSHQLEYGAGPLLYRDIYFGEAYFVGQETVYASAWPIWAMCYAGGFTPRVSDQSEANEIGGVLQAALREVTPEQPYRGPSTFRRGIYSYVNESEGDVYRFSGIETIAREEEVVYQLRYSGGLLR
jgi:hypothetical protein